MAVAFNSFQHLLHLIRNQDIHICVSFLYYKLNNQGSTQELIFFEVTVDSKHSDLLN